MTLQTAFNQYVQHGVYLRGWSPHTVAIYRRAFANFQAALRDSGTDVPTGSDPESAMPNTGGPEVPLTKSSLEAWVVWMRQQKRSSTYINIHIRAINAFLNWMFTEELLPKKLRQKQVPNPQQVLRGISDKEVALVLAYRPKIRNSFRTWTLIQLLLDTGCRIDELLSLRVENVDLDNLLLTVRGKGNRIRPVPISTECRKVLYRYRQLLQKRGIASEWFFCTSNGTQLQYRNTYRDIKRLCRHAGVEGKHVHPHAFRHKFAVTYVMRGGDIYRLSRILGHSTISTTQIYLRSMGIEQIAEAHSHLSPLAR